MNKDLHSKWILDDRKDRHFVSCTNQDLVKEIAILSEEEWAYENYIKIKKIANSINRLTREEYSTSKEALDLFISIPLFFFNWILDKYKSYLYGNMYESNERAIAEFHEVNIPLIRMMDYFLEKRAFRHLDLVANRLEKELLVLWFELTSARIYEIIEEDIHNPNLLFIFARIGNKAFESFFKKDYLCIMQNAPFEAFETLFKNGVVSKDYIDNSFFLEAFKGYYLSEQIILAELLVDSEFDSEFIKKLHKLFNKNAEITEYNFTMNAFEMSSERFELITKTISNSSYFIKENVQSSELWTLLTLGYNSNIDLTIDYYTQIMDLYYACREYATKSIVDALYPLNTLSDKVTCLTGEFNILARVRTMWEADDLDETFRIRTFCSFSILTEKNMSHYGNSVLYGYYTGITPDLIAHIYPIDSLSKSGAKFESQLTNKMNMLLDIGDLNEATLKCKTYNQLCIRTKSNGEILHPDCIVCITEVDSYSKQVADEMNLPIVILSKMPNTIENNQDIYGDLM